MKAILLLHPEDDVQTREARMDKAEVDIIVEGDGLGFLKPVGTLCKRYLIKTTTLT